MVFKLALNYFKFFDKHEIKFPHSSTFRENVFRSFITSQKVNLFTHKKEKSFHAHFASDIHETKSTVA